MTAIWKRNQWLGQNQQNHADGGTFVGSDGLQIDFASAIGWPIGATISTSSYAAFKQVDIMVTNLVRCAMACGRKHLKKQIVTVRHGKIHPFLIAKPSISMGHLYHGELLNNQRVYKIQTRG